MKKTISVDEELIVFVLIARFMNDLVCDLEPVFFNRQCGLVYPISKVQVERFGFWEPINLSLLGLGEAEKVSFKFTC